MCPFRAEQTCGEFDSALDGQIGQVALECDQLTRTIPFRVSNLDRLTETLLGSRSARATLDIGVLHHQQ